MNSIDYKLSTIDRSELLEPIIRATETVMRYDGLIAHSIFKNGLKSREHFSAAVASIYLQGGLVEFNDLLLHCYNTDISISYQDLADAKDVLDARRLIDTKNREWIFEENSFQLTEKPIEAKANNSAMDDFSKQLSDIDALLERTNKILENPKTLEIKPSRLKQLLKPQNSDLQWKEWQNAIDATAHEPPILRSALLLDAWGSLDPIPNKPWLGYEYANASMRIDLKLSFLPAITVGLRQIPRDVRKSNTKLKRLKAYINSYTLSGEAAIRDCQKIATRYKTIQSNIKNIRAGSKINAFIDYAIANPIIMTSTAAKDLKISQAGVLKMLKQLRLREITGRSRYRAWTII